jgi:transposase
LEKYPTADVLSRAKKTAVAKIPYITPQRAKEMIANAQKSIASATDKITSQLIIATVSQIIHLKKTIKAQTQLLVKECSIDEVDLLKTFPGINVFSAVGLMIEIQTATRFANIKKLASFFGIHPELKVSGDGMKQVRMSKKGRKEPRRILYMVTLSAIQCNPLIKRIYEDRIEKGMERMASVGYCMHKILRIIYGMLKHNTPFDAEIDRKNREKKVFSKKSASKDKNRRYQDFDPKAPISRRQNKKRMERELSHSDNSTKSGIHTPRSNL